MKKKESYLATFTVCCSIANSIKIEKAKGLRANGDTD